MSRAILICIIRHFIFSVYCFCGTCPFCAAAPDCHLLKGQFADQLSIQRLTRPTLHRRRRNYSKFVKFLLNSWNFAGHFGWRPQPVAYPTLSGPCRTNERFGTLTWKPIVFLDRRHSHEEVRELSWMAGVLHRNLAARWDESGRQGICGRPRRQRSAYHPRRVVEEQNVDRWAADMVHKLSEKRIEEPASAHVGVNGA
jgi:hypothetical protein